ncbi:MAG: hypothetical protein KIT33_15910 [Candidatus Kapabacteria bacterium]|nr:hypothetical protein [Ignavibacteriota bacterium]MCW5886457.1 hypothetical protein [Candidatus Kapabacteria bacterium]
MLDRLKLKIDLAEQGFGTLLEKVKHLKLSRTPAFKPVALPIRPHLYWYIFRNEKRFIELGIIGMATLAFIILLIKNWR